MYQRRNRDYRWISSSPQHQNAYYRYSEQSQENIRSSQINESNRSISPIISPSSKRNISYNNNITPKRTVLPEKMVEDCIITFIYLISSLWWLFIWQ